ncbi:uncharacterized protein LOC143449578 [Clavelina lepadiformis]|uniref:uncharacterized protein LOC143449578 n=1 Tax=Clavelina lepadiformis TaxID=159417 RepID=UPI0040426189
MTIAIRAVNEKRMGYHKASKEYGVPKTTLKRRVQGDNVNATGSKKGLGRFHSTFSEAQEKELVSHVLELERQFFGVTRKHLQSLAFELAEKNQIKHRFNMEKRLAGADWVSGFLQRNPQLSLRTPEPTSAARARGFNRVSVGKFFALLGEVMNLHHFKHHNVFNVDKTGITTVQTKQSKVLALKGKKQVGSITSAERGTLCTAVICMSAGGSYVPPYLIFPRQRMKPELLDGTPPGTGYSCHPSGLMQLDIFTSWFKHFYPLLNQLKKILFS